MRGARIVREGRALAGADEHAAQAGALSGEHVRAQVVADHHAGGRRQVRARGTRVRKIAAEGLPITRGRTPAA